MLRETEIFNTLNKVLSNQNITKSEFLDLTRIMSRIFSIEYFKPNSDYPLLVILMDTILVDARKLCIVPVPEMDIYDVMDYYIAK